MVATVPLFPCIPGEFDVSHFDKDQSLYKNNVQKKVKITKKYLSKRKVINCGL